MTGPIVGVAQYCSLLVIAKQPVPGKVKTRLAATVGDVAAAEIARACLDDTFAAASKVHVSQRVVALAGARGAWVPDEWLAVTQCAGGLDRRLGDAFTQVARCGPAFLIGMDTPQVTPELLTEFDPSRYDACIGPATDGGYWAIGFAEPARAASVIHDVPMSVEQTYDVQLRRLVEAGMTIQTLPVLTDVDTYDDALRVAETMPESRFGRAVANLSCLAVS